MTRFRVCVNPESRDTPRVHAHDEEKHSDSVPAWRAIGAAVLTPSAYSDHEKEEND
jgi:hypothetical protein